MLEQSRYSCRCQCFRRNSKFDDNTRPRLHRFDGLVFAFRCASSICANRRQQNGSNEIFHPRLAQFVVVFIVFLSFCSSFVLVRQIHHTPTRESQQQHRPSLPYCYYLLLTSKRNPSSSPLTQRRSHTRKKDKKDTLEQRCSLFLL